MSLTLRHRGPDAFDEWVDAESGIAFGFRRLAIIDLSPAGDQPMHSHSGRYTIIFNGEVYNFRKLRRELEDTFGSIGFRGHSDTEVILECVERWGLESAVRRFVGMFAFALWDSVTRELHLVRDRVGVKPLYYGWCGPTLTFGSELKALRAAGEFDSTIDPDALALFVRFSCIPAPKSIFRSVRKLEPGTILTFRSPRDIRKTTYWNAFDVYARGMARRFAGPAGEAAERLDALLHESVELRMISDVPLGVFLSGGIDSSTVTAIMQASSSQPVKSFSVGFGASDFDESQHARRVAEYLGTDHTEIIMDPADVLPVIPRLPLIYDEPFGDSSAIPTVLVSELARRHVTVSLSGDGGDEVFGGYNRYSLAPRLWRLFGALPRPLRSAAGRVMNIVRPSVWSALANVTTFGRRHLHVADKAKKVAKALSAPDADAFYWELLAQWPERTVAKHGAAHPVRLATKDETLDAEFTDRMMYYDLVSYLPDDILVKLDRATMSVSLEGREPLLDHRLIEFAATLPLNMKVRGAETKWLLRQVLRRYVPREILERPKSGFEIPLADWLRGPLRDWAEALLDEKSISCEGLLRADEVARRWRQHLRGEANHQHGLWNVLMYRAWAEEQRVLQAAEPLERVIR